VREGEKKRFEAGDREKKQGRGGKKKRGVFLRV